MHKREALKLKRGDRIRFGDSMWTRDCDHRWRNGVVDRVTPAGGVLVVTAVGTKWVPYHFVSDA